MRVFVSYSHQQGPVGLGSTGSGIEGGWGGGVDRQGTLPTGQDDSRADGRFASPSLAAFAGVFAGLSCQRLLPT